MITVQAIYTSPVKSLALQTPARVYVGHHGIAGDRRFYLVDEVGKLLTQRELRKLVQIGAEYTEDPEWLRLDFPDGNNLQGPVILGRGIGTKIWGRRVSGHVVEGDWHRALSEFCGQPVHLIASDSAGQAFDEFPVSVVSQASLERLNQERLNQERLSQESLNQLVAETLGCKVFDALPPRWDRDSEQLATLVMDKTEGNPFFVVQFLTSLYTEVQVIDNIE